MSASLVCAYTGPPDQCHECGGFDPTGTGTCSHDCAHSRADRVAQIRAAEQARRQAEDAFAREVDRLRAEGHTDLEIDELLKDMP